MTGDEIYGVWLQQALGEGSRRVPQLIEYFGSCRAVYEADNTERMISGLLNQKELSMLSDTPLDAACEIVEACHRLRYRIMTPDSDDYPNRLLNISDYPAALYICGEWPDIDNEVCIAMVGTRRASRYGYGVAVNLARELAACGAIVISGCARGIDTASHNGAILAGGKTVAVLGCGINTRYNMENEGLRQVISTSGALISEYPPGAPPLNYHFPVRNRIISGLSLGVIVVEAGARSGSLITANLALEQGRDIFSVPGEINNNQAKGTNRLIFDGAVPIENAADVLCQYIEKFPHRIVSNNLANPNSMIDPKHVRPKWDRAAKAAENHKKASVETELSSDAGTHDGTAKKEAEKMPSKPSSIPEPQESRAPLGMSESAQKVWNALGAAPKHFQDLLAELGMDSSELSRSITELELYAAVRSLPGNRYSKG